MIEDKKQYFKEYYERNKEKIKSMVKESNNIYKRCECGCLVKNLAVHKRSKKHQEFMGNIDVIETPKTRTRT
jgi:hypothetical protein